MFVCERACVFVYVYVCVCVFVCAYVRECTCVPVSFCISSASLSLPLCEGGMV